MPPDPSQPPLPDDLPDHPGVTYDPGCSLLAADFGAAYPSNFPAYRGSRNQGTVSMLQCDALLKLDETEHALPILEELCGKGGAIKVLEPYAKNTVCR